MERQAHPVRPTLHLRRVEGLFFRAVPTDRLDRVLAPPGPDSAGRYHRPGQPTLYLSPEKNWAIIAVSGYMREDRRPRSVVPLRLDGALVLDHRDEDAC